MWGDRSGFKSVRKKLDNLPQKHPILFAHLIFQSILKNFETKIWPPLNADTRIKRGNFSAGEAFRIICKGEKESQKFICWEWIMWRPWKSPQKQSGQSEGTVYCSKNNNSIQARSKKSVASSEHFSIYHTLFRATWQGHMNHLFCVTINSPYTKKSQNLWH